MVSGYDAKRRMTQAKSIWLRRDLEIENRRDARFAWRESSPGAATLQRRDGNAASLGEELRNEQVFRPDKRGRDSFSWSW